MMRAARGGRLLGGSVLALGFGFLYLPILLLMAYSFNTSRLATVWGGFSTRWYGELLRDRQLLDAAWVSLEVAFWTACASTVLGTMAAMAMVRMRRFPGKTLFGALITAPLVMPEVIIGLSILLLLVSMGGVLGIAPRGAVAIWVAHVTFTVSFVTVVISSRLQELDRSLEEAAMDLGATPLRVFFQITLPIIAPALASGWLLAFTLSLDDLVIASFTAGPSTNTLPMMIFSKVRLGVTPEINALATIMVSVVAVFVVVAGVLLARQERMRLRDSQAAARG